MNADHFGIVITFLVLLVVLAITAVSAGLGGLEIPSIIPETTPEPNSYYEWCYQMKIACQG
jgi:hypothetical protein